MTVLLLIATGCITSLFAGAYLEHGRRRRKLLRIELFADTTRHDEYRKALAATGGGSW